MVATSENEPAGTAVPLAPVWHTASLVALVLLVAVTGTLLGGSSTAPVSVALPESRILWSYVPALVVAWTLVIYVSVVGRSRSALAALLGERRRSLRDVAVDLVIAALLWSGISGAEVGYGCFCGPATSPGVAALLPSTPAEHVLWVFVAASVGFAEEVVYRGYLRTQLAAFTRSFLAGNTLQAALFGVAHAEQGLAVALRFAVYGAVFGAVARRRAGLAACIVAHVAIDVVSGLVR